MLTKTQNPMTATIDMTCADCTVIVLDVFGRKMANKVAGPDHYGRAQRTVERWTKHLDQEWENLRGTSAVIMEWFSQALLDLGVSEETIVTAQDEVDKRAITAAQQ